MKKISLDEAKNYQAYYRTPTSPDPAFYTVEVDQDGWETMTYYSKHNKINTDGIEGSEWVYVLSNDYMPGIFKIGFTYNAPEERAAQLFKTGTPDEFKIAYRCKCFNGMRIERAVHSKLKKQRIRMDREFFRVNLDDAIRTIEEMKTQFG
jgi:hypothetical protein